VYLNRYGLYLNLCYLVDINSIHNETKDSLSKFNCVGCKVQHEPDMSHYVSTPYTRELISTFMVFYSKNKTEVKFNVCIYT